jgi:hypothetical protein
LSTLPHTGSPFWWPRNSSEEAFPWIQTRSTRAENRASSSCQASTQKPRETQWLLLGRTKRNYLCTNTCRRGASTPLFSVHFFLQLL